MITKVTMITVVVALGISYIAMIFLWSYIPYQLMIHGIIQNKEIIPENKANQQLQNKSDLLLYLNDLTAFPIVGAFFMEQKVYELAVIGSWKEVIKVSNEAIQNFINHNSFFIWYHKALAECVLGHLEDCEQSTRLVSYLSNDDYNRHAVFLYEMLKNEEQNRIIKQRLKSKHQIFSEQQPQLQIQQELQSQDIIISDINDIL